MLTSSALFFGLLLGVRHAFEPDHLAAVSTLVAERPNPRRGLVLGVSWGLGHSLALFAVGLLLALLQAQMPPRLADTFELLVAFMLVALGARALIRGVRGERVRERPDGVHRHESWFAPRSLAIGVVHGLAGSGALTALVLAHMPTFGARLAYILLFGLGSIAGMATLSAAAGFPLVRLARSRRFGERLRALVGLGSLGLGVVWGWPLVGRVFWAG